MDEKPKYRIGNGMAVLLLGAAAFTDLLTLIPFAGDFIGWLFWGLCTIYFWRKGMGVINMNRFVPALISSIAELFPVVQEFPTIVVAMFAILVLTRIEDKSGLKILPTKGKPGVTPPKVNRVPRYSNGVGRTTQESDRQLRSPNGGIVTDQGPAL